MADLTVHQIFQEELQEEQRGAVCGVQAGLQSLMDLIKFLLVFFLPHQNTFGILIVLSYLVTDGLLSKISSEQFFVAVRDVRRDFLLQIQVPVCGVSEGRNRQINIKVKQKLYCYF